MAQTIKEIERCGLPNLAANRNPPGCVTTYLKDTHSRIKRFRLAKLALPNLVRRQADDLFGCVTTCVGSNEELSEVPTASANNKWQTLKD